MVTASCREALVEKLLGGDFAPDRPLPSIRRLATEYRISPSSVKRVMDELQDEGLVVAVHGRGFFLSGGSHVPRRRRKTRMMALSTTRDPAAPSPIPQLQDYWLSRGWLLTTHNPLEERQDPEKERAFIAHMREAGMSGIALDPSPLPPQNGRFFHEQRLLGFKIALLSPYQEDLTEESFFVRDFRHAGYLCASRLGLCGYANIAFARLPGLTIFHRWQRAGMVVAIQDLGLRQLDDLVLRNWRQLPGTPEEIMTQRLVDHESQLDWLTGLPGNTGIVASQSNAAELVRQLAVKAGREVPGDLGICDAFGDRAAAYRNSGVRFAEFDQINAALAYIADEKIKATTRVQRWFRPEFVVRNSTRPSYLHRGENS